MPKIAPHPFTYRPGSRINKLLTPCNVCKAYHPALQKPEASTEFTALWDTGAEISGISRNVINALGLVPFAPCMSYHAGGCKPTNLYKVNIMLPNGVGFHTMTVMEAVLKDCDVLIGMDIITQGDFAITHSDGNTTFSFQIPSVKNIDFEKEVQPIAPPLKANNKIGRNEPCPCGSGKKYKKCCGLKS